MNKVVHELVIVNTDSEYTIKCTCGAIYTQIIYEESQSNVAR